MNVLELFAGAGGGLLASALLGHSTVCAVEIDRYCRDVLLARQRDRQLPPFPIWDDVRTFDGRPWRGLVDIVAGGFPCQDISCAGKGIGIHGARSALWSEMARVVREVRPRFVFVENSPRLTSRGLGRVLGDLAALGYGVEWDVFGAHHVGAPHRRERIWLLAHADGAGEHVLSVDAQVAGPRAAVADTGGKRCDSGSGNPRTGRPGRAIPWRSPWWKAEPDVDRVADGVAHGVDRNRALGNGQVPAVAARAWWTLSRRMNSNINERTPNDTSQNR